MLHTVLAHSCLLLTSTVLAMRIPQFYIITATSGFPHLAISRHPLSPVIRGRLGSSDASTVPLAGGAARWQVSRGPLSWQLWASAGPGWSRQFKARLRGASEVSAATGRTGVCVSTVPAREPSATVSRPIWQAGRRIE